MMILEATPISIETMEPSVSIISAKLFRSLLLLVIYKPGVPERGGHAIRDYN